MKKNIFTFSIISLIGVVIIYYLFKCENKQDIDEIIENIPSNAENVIYIEMKEETEGGYIYHKTEERQLIEKIVNELNKINIKNKINLMFNDNTKIYTLKLHDGTALNYCFQNNYYHKDNINYEMYNYEELMKIKIPEMIEK